MHLGPRARRARRTRTMTLARSVLALGAIIGGSLGLAVPFIEARTSAQDALARVTALSCRFTLLATGTWQNGEARADVKPSTLSIAFKDIDLQDGMATVVEAFGPSEIVVRLSGGNLHLMQMGGSSGALYVTSVFSRQTREGRLQAVHTRHEYAEISVPGFTSRPEQYYGDCAAQ